MKTRTGKFLLVVVGVFLAFVLAEILVRVFLPQDKMVTWIEMHPRGFMMNQPGIEALHEFDDRKLRYQFDENGLRGGESIRKDATNILLLGDSFTFGLMLQREDTYASILQKNLDSEFSSQDIQVLNGGVGGAGLADWPGWLEYKGERISPDIVILYLNYMDVHRALSKNLYVVNEDGSGLTDSIRWKLRPGLLALGRMGWYRRLQEHSQLMNILVKIAWKYLYYSDQTDNFSQESSSVTVPPEDAFDPESEYSLQLSKLLVGRMREWCDRNDCTLIVTTSGFFEKDMAETHTYKYYESLKNTGPDKFHFFDNTLCVQEKINGDYDSIRIPNDSHPDEKGAKIIADCSITWLKPFLKQYMDQP